MKKLKITAVLEYDDKLMHGDDKESTEWFNTILRTEELIVVSDTIGDDIGTLKITGVKGD